VEHYQNEQGFPTLNVSKAAKVLKVTKSTIFKLLHPNRASKF